MQKKEEVDLSHEKKNLKKIFTMVENELFIQENHSQLLGGGTKYSCVVTEVWVSQWAVPSPRQ